MSTPRRNEVIDYIKERYGEVYQIRTVSYLQEKSAVQRAAQALDGAYQAKLLYDIKQTEEFKKKFAEDSKKALSEARASVANKHIVTPAEYTRMSKNINVIEDMPEKTNTEKKWKEVALKFRGHIISFGCHASAVLVSPEDVCHWTAIEKQGDNMVVCHDFHQLEAQGLLKLDILGLETLDIIEQTKHRAGIDIDISKVPVDDKATAEMLRRGDTSGCFQIESNVMTGIILRMGVKTVEDMSSVVALGRPGPLDSGMVETFLKRRNHQERTTYDIPELEPILRDTEGVILYQEQVMQIARKLCGYSLGEADNLRRIIGRKVVDEMQPAVDDMIKRGVQNGYTEKQMKKVTDNIITFANYGFNRAHSAAYGMTAWVTAYLKAHYPAAFMASLLDSSCKDKPKMAGYVLQAMNMGIRVLPPQLDHHNCHSGYDEDGGYIILGLNCIAGVGNTEIPKGAPKDFYSFIESNVNMNKTVLKNLVKAGVFEGNRDEMLQYIEWAKDKRKSKGVFKYTPTEYNEQLEESKVIGISFGDIFSKYKMDIVNNIDIFGYEVLNVKGRKTKTGKNMAFVKVRNNDTVKDLVIFNDRYKEIKAHGVYIMKVRNNRIFDFTEARPA